MLAYRYIVAAGIVLVLVGCHRSGSLSESSSSTGTSRAIVKITASDDVCWSGQVGGAQKSGCGDAAVYVESSGGTYSVKLGKTKGSGEVTVKLIVEGKTVDSAVVTQSSVVTVDSRN